MKILGLPPKNLALGALGAAVGGWLGDVLFFWIAQQGFYALAIPGGLLGLGSGWLVKQRSIPFATLCGVAALALGLFSEWRLAPFIADKSLGYFLTHVSQLRPVTLILLALGVYLGFRLSLRRESAPKSPPP